MRIALLTDTHLPREIRDLGELGPQVEQFLTGADLILHGGDTVSARVFDWLEQFAPVLAVEGNNDLFEDPRMKMVQFLDIEGWRLAMRHDIPDNAPVDFLRERYFEGDAPDIIVYGHTHFEALEYREGTLMINSGSPDLPHHYSPRLGTVGLLEITREGVHAEIVRLGESEGKRNPGIAMAMRLQDGVATTVPPLTDGGAPV